MTPIIINSVLIPHNLNAKLKTYQKKGFLWMEKTLERHHGCLLADEMGLGKTVQVITLLLHYKNTNVINKEKKAFIILPKSLINNWLKEFEKFAPSLNIEFFTPNIEISNAEIILITYNTVLYHKSLFENLTPYIVILDEGHKIKNYYTKLAASIRNLNSLKRILITGTPIENNLKELINLVNYVYFDKIGEIPKIDSDFNFVKFLKKYLEPYTLRRIKNKRTINLPPLYKKDVICELSSLQKKKYVEIAPLGISYKDIISIRSHYYSNSKNYALSDLDKLKRICNYPARGNYRIMHSGKLIELVGIVKSIPPNDKILLFTYDLNVIKACKYILTEQLDYQVLTLQGEDSSDKRIKVIEKFQQSPSIRIMILSLKVGGMGLNITAANHVIIFDLWWNMAVESQAIGRCYRQGQEKPVYVYRFITKDTLEESINHFIKEKEEVCQFGMSAFNDNPFVNHQIIHDTSES